MYYKSNVRFLNADKSLQSSEVVYTETNFSDRNVRNERLWYEATGSSRISNCLDVSFSIDYLGIK